MHSNLPPHPAFPNFNVTASPNAYTTTSTAPPVVRSSRSTTGYRTVTEYVTDSTGRCPEQGTGSEHLPEYVPLDSLGLSPALLHDLGGMDIPDSCRYETETNREAEIRGMSELNDLRGVKNRRFATTQRGSRLDIVGAVLKEGVPVKGYVVEFKDKTAKKPRCCTHHHRDGPMVDVAKVEYGCRIAGKHGIAFYVTWMYANAFAYAKLHNGRTENRALIERAKPEWRRREGRSDYHWVYYFDWSDLTQLER